MLKFKKLNEKNIKEIQNFTKNSKYPLCDYSGGVIFTWYSKYNPSYAISGDSLFVKFDMNGDRFLLPLGGDFEESLNEIEKYCVINEKPIKFICVDQKTLTKLEDRYKGGLKSSFNRDFSDYIYDIEEIKTFKGKKFSGQRNHINSFKREYPNYEYKKISPQDYPKIKAFLKEYDKQYPNKKKIEKREFEFTSVLLEYLKNSNLFGGYIQIDGKVVAISIGEYVGNNLVIHVEKALLKYRGAYPLMFNEFTNHNYKEGIKFVNRQDDSGDLGLRTSKTQYKPIKLENKYYVEIESFMPKFKKPKLKGEKVSLLPLKRKDVKAYYKLYTAKSNNKWWGYNYTKFIKNPSVDYFYKMQYNDFIKRKNMVLGIYENKSLELLGEVVLYNFTRNSNAEIGIRLFKKHQGKGYASEALKLISSFAQNNLSETLNMKCYKANEKSKNLIEKNGFILIKEDKKMYYFEKIKNF